MGFSRRRLKFQAKVLLPVVAVLVVFVAATLWLFNSGSKRQLRENAGLQRDYAQVVFLNSLALRTNGLVEALKSRISQSEFYSIPKALNERWNDSNGVVSAEDTMSFSNSMAQDFFPKLLAAVNDSNSVALFVLPWGESVQFSENKSLPSDKFKVAAAPSVKAVRDSFAAHAPSSDVRGVEFENRLFDLVSIPCFGASDEFLGVVCVGVEMGRAFVDKTTIPDSEIVFVVNGHVVVSSFANPPPEADLLKAYYEPANLVVIQDNHYAGQTGHFPLFSGPGDAGYLLLASYEKSWVEFRDTQRTLLLGSLAGIILGTAVVWFLVRRVTRPLRDLRNSAEAVGRGDFSKRIEIASDDELGELAAVFNQMTENLQKSLAQLEKTVESLRSTQAQLAHSEKLSVVGEFVAGVAHELNNPLTALIGFSELLLMGQVDPASRDSLQRICNSAERCHKIVQSLLGFARQRPPERKLTSVNSVVDAVVEILIYELRTSNITIVKDYAPDLPRLLIDPHQIQQVFLNIINNARQAIEAHQPKGAIRLVTKSAGPRVQIRFEDNGPGISPENLAKIFNPFFTTKPVGKGTGLGLSLSYGTIQEHGGQIIVESKVGQGTTFIIELPVSASPGETPPEAAVSPGRTTAKVHGKKILLVDDESDILELLAKVLARDGYAVEKALDGQRALDCLARSSFDLIVTDWKMPGMNGPQLHARLLETNPAAAGRMIFMTGDVLSEKVEKYLAEHGKFCLGKPFSIKEFQAAIAPILDKK